jgi:hypothetical protein
MEGGKITKDTTKNIDKLLKNKLEEAYLKVGVIEGQQYPDGTSVAQVGAENEFGFENIPARSFLRMPLTIKGKQIQDIVSKYVEKKLANGDVEGLMEIMGQACDKIIQEAFESRGFGQWQENADLTIELKESDSPLIDTDVLRKSITYKVVI